MAKVLKFLSYASIFSAPFFVTALDPPEEDLDAEEVPSDVVKLTSDNFDETLAASQYVLVKFYAPWCGHCKAMAPDYEKAATQLKGEAVLSEVDATVETELATKYEVQGYPTLFWFVNGNKREYQGPRTADGIVEWVKANMGPILKTMTAEESKEVLAARKGGDAVILFNGDVEEIAGKVADEARASATYALVKDGEKKVTMYRGSNETVVYDGEWTQEAVSAWVSKERTPFFGQITEDNFEIYMEHAKNGLFWVCLSPKTVEEDFKKYASEFVEAAKAQTGDVKFPFVWLDVAEFEAHAKEELGCSTFPTIVLQRGDLLGDREEVKVEKFLRTFSENPEELNAGAVDTFFKDIASGALEPVAEPDELDALDDDETEDQGEGEDLDDGEDEEAPAEVGSGGEEL